MLRFVLTLALALESTSATAQTTADDLVRRGLEARQEGRDLDAARLFEEAYALDPSPRALAQWALAEQATGAWVSAEARLVRALDTGGPWIESHRAVLEQALVTIRGHLAEIQIDCNVEGADVHADGAPAGTTPLASPIRVRAGTVVIELRAPGYFATRRPIDVEAGAIHRERVELVAMSREEPPPPRPASAAPAAPRVETDAGEVQQVFAWLGIGLGAASLAGSALAWGIREDALSVWNDDAMCDRELGPGRDDECAAEGDRWRAAQTWSIVGLTAGVASLAVGVVLLIFLPRETSDLALDCVPFSPTAACVVRF